MRKFIVSDLHGDGNIYKSIMSYLDNINLSEEIILYINGDLIDKGIESVEMLLDIKKRIASGPFKIEYLGGNHELMMFQTYHETKSKYYYSLIWEDFGGWQTQPKLEESGLISVMVDFVGNLKIYHKFTEKINNANIVLVHASCPLVVNDICDLQIKDNNTSVEECVWHRKLGIKPKRIGNKEYFSIVGHTRNRSTYGAEYHADENYLNIDGGCAQYVSGFFEYDHIPLVEVKDGYLKVLTFNHNNEIIYGNYFKDGIFIPFNDYEMAEERKHLDRSFKPKKLVKLGDGVVGYDDWYKNLKA